MSTQIKSSHALRISLELKKRLVDGHQLDCTQSTMERVIFNLMRTYNYGEEYVHLYSMMSRFHHERIPLLILIAGTGCVGKSPIARKLSEQLNLPAVLHMDVIYEISCEQEPIWCRSYAIGDDDGGRLLEDYRRESQELRRCIEPEIRKCLDEGKSLIIEGIHLNYPIHGRWLEEHAKNAIIIPFLLQPADIQEHEILARRWIKQEMMIFDEERISRSYRFLQSIQNYLYENHHNYFHIVHVHVDEQRETVQWMHRTILDEMKRYFHRSIC